MNSNWDKKWQLESQTYDDYFVMEAANPLTSMKFREGDTQRRVQCYRWDIGANEQSAWVRVPQNQQLSCLAELHCLATNAIHSIRLRWLHPGSRSRGNATLKHMPD